MSPKIEPRDVEKGAPTNAKAGITGAQIGILAVAGAVLLGGGIGIGYAIGESSATGVVDAEVSLTPVQELVAADDSCTSSKVAEHVTWANEVGGTLYVTKASDPTKWTHSIDLAEAALAAPINWNLPGVKPHMIIPSPNGKYAAIAYTGDQGIHIVNTQTKELTHCVRADFPAPGVVGKAIHTVSWLSDDVILLNDMTGSVNGVGGGAIHKFSITWEKVYNDDGSIQPGYTHLGSLSIGATKAARGATATKPIALGNNPLGDKSLFFVTDAKGGGSIINAETLAVVKNFAVSDFAPCKGGGLWVEPHPSDPDIVIAQYGSQDSEDGATKSAECLFKIDLKKEEIAKTYVLPADADDTHGLQFCKNSAGDDFLVVVNRASGTLDVLDYETGATVVDDFDLNKNLPDYSESILQPDVSYLTDGTLFIAARGAKPVSAVKPYNFLPKAVSGLFYLDLDDCVNPKYSSEYKLATDPSRSIIPSDVHGIWGIGDEIWVLDQAATGSLESYTVYNAGCKGQNVNTHNAVGGMGR